MADKSVIDNIKRLENRPLSRKQTRQRREAYELGKKIAKKIFAG